MVSSWGIEETLIQVKGMLFYLLEQQINMVLQLISYFELSKIIKLSRAFLRNLLSSVVSDAINIDES